MRNITATPYYLFMFLFVAGCGLLPQKTKLINWKIFQ